MRYRLVISMSVIEFPDSDRYTDQEVQTVATVTVENGVNATDHYDRMLNAGRLAEQANCELFRRWAAGVKPKNYHYTPDPFGPSDRVTNEAIAKFLRDRITELKGTEPVESVTFEQLSTWANELDPQWPLTKGESCSTN